MTTNASKASQHRQRRLRMATASGATGSCGEASLDTCDLEELLVKTIQPHCHNTELGQQARHQFRGLAERGQLSRTEIQDIITILLQVLDSPTIAPTLVSYIHSTIGLLYLTENETKLAIQSFTKALWVETTMDSPNDLDIGLVLFRLAKCRMRLGDRFGASSLLEKALKLYKECPAPNHSYIQHAQEELDHTKKEKMPRRMAMFPQHQMIKEGFA